MAYTKIKADFYRQAQVRNGHSWPKSSLLSALSPPDSSIHMANEPMVFITNNSYRQGLVTRQTVNKSHCQRNVMKKVILFGAVLLAGLATDSIAQTASQKPSTGVASQQSASANTTTGSTDGMQRKGTGKMSSGVTRNGNSNLSPTSPTNTQGSTSQGSASIPSAGGAKGTRTVAAKQPNAPKSTKNGTASDGGSTGNGTPAYGGKANTKSTSGSTGGSQRPTTAAAVKKEAKTSDANVSTNGAQPTGAGKAGTPAGTASGKKAAGNSYPQTGTKKQ